MSIKELDSPLINFNSLHKLWAGRKRSAHAVMTVIKIDAAYRKTAKKVVALSCSLAESQKLYKKTHEENAQRLYDLCHDNGGSWAKFGQFLSARPDLLPREYIKALEPLQNDISPTPFAELEPLLTDQLGGDWRELFSKVNEEPIATASIGQVHKATLKDGRKVAVKIQLPHIKKLFSQDVILFRILAKLLSNRIPQIDLSNMVGYLLKTISEELDFTNEASNITAFGKLHHIPGVKVPTLIAELSTEKVITTEWIQGVRLVDYLKRTFGDKQKKILYLLQNSYMQQAMWHGIYQGDPHPGNFLVDRDANLHILDYGYMGRLTPTETANFSRLIMVITQNSHEDMLTVLNDSGFEGLTEEMFQGKSLTMIESMSGMNRSGGGAQIDVVISALLEQFRENRITVPDYFISVGRVFITVGGLLRTYDVPFNIMSNEIVTFGKTER